MLIIQIIKKMNITIDDIYPNPEHSLISSNLNFAPIINSLLLCGSSNVKQQKTEEPKKKFAFKASTTSVTSQPIYIFDLVSKSWRKEQAKGKVPSKREHPLTLVLGEYLFLYGGKSTTSPVKQLNDLYALNLNTWQWKKLFAIQAPASTNRSFFKPLSKHKLALITEQLWTFSIKDVKWELNSNELPGGVWQKMSIKIPPNIILADPLWENAFLIISKKESTVQAHYLSNQKLQIAELSAPKMKQWQDINCLEMARSSQGSFVMMVNGTKFISFVRSGTTLEFGQQQTLDSKLQNLITVDYDNQFINFIYQKELISVEIVKEQQNTARLINPQEEEDQQRGINSYGIQVESNEEYLEELQLSQVRNSQHQQEQNEEENYEIEEQGHQQSQKQNLDAHNLQKRMKQILANECLKRKVLQTKSKMLQSHIKKAEKMALTLCRYSPEHEKSLHIQKVKQIRQNLEVVWNRQMYFRKQIESKESNINMEQILQQNLDQQHCSYFI